MAEYDDAAASDQFAADRAQEPQGAARRRRAPSLSTHVPIRFNAAVIESVKALAAEDGQTVSSWIRAAVEREIVRRQHPVTGLAGLWEFQVVGGIQELSVTESSGRVPEPA